MRKAVGAVLTVAILSRSLAVHTITFQWLRTDDILGRNALVAALVR